MASMSETSFGLGTDDDLDYIGGRNVNEVPEVVSNLSFSYGNGASCTVHAMDVVPQNERFF